MLVSVFAFTNNTVTNIVILCPDILHSGVSVQDIHIEVELLSTFNFAMLDCLLSGHTSLYIHQEGMRPTVYKLTNTCLQMFI